jgi:arylamine N-acetyltransferase
VTQQPPTLDAPRCSALLERLGVARAAPSASGLAELQRAWLERIPYEVVWIHEGLRWGVDPIESVDRIVHEGRGGFCYHLNGAFGSLLATLGYDVGFHVGGVFFESPTHESMGNHLVLIVDGVPDVRCPDGRWYVDVGLGDGPSTPLPLVAGRHDDGPLTYGLRPTGSDAVGEWCLDHDPLGSFPGMTFDTERVALDAFAARCDELQTAPTSAFVQTCVVIRRRLERIDVVRDRVWKTITAAGVERGVFADADEWAAALAGDLALPLAGRSGPAVAAVWDGIRERHEARERQRAKGPAS